MIHAKHKSASNFSDILDLWKALLSQLPQVGKHFLFPGRKKRNLSYMAPAGEIDDLFPIIASFKSTNREAILI